MEKKPTHRIVAVDLDGVILDSMNGIFNVDQYDPTELEKYPTMKGCKRVLGRLIDNGFTVVIHTSRTNPDYMGNKPYTLDQLMDALDADLVRRGVPFTYISEFKPVADMYLDDRGWHFRDWAQAEKDLEMLGYLPSVDE